MNKKIIPSFVAIGPRNNGNYQVKPYNKPFQTRYYPSFSEAKGAAKNIAKRDQIPWLIRNTNGRIAEFNNEFVPPLLSISDNNPLLINGDCIQEMTRIASQSINLILVDLPYGTTQNKWDAIIPFDKMWDSFNRIIKDDGAIVLTATQPFSSKLVMSNINNFKYEIIWEKTIGSGQLNIKRQPLRTHESILIFYKKYGTYNEQKTKGEPYSINRKIKSKGEGYGVQTDSSKKNDGFRHARSVVKFSNPRIKNGHPTQKPVELMEYLIKTFSNENDIVLDCCMGSGTTGVAAKNLNRRFIGIELDNNYYKIAKERINT